VLGRIFSIIPGLHPLDANRSPQNVIKMFLDTGKWPLGTLSHFPIGKHRFTSIESKPGRRNNYMEFFFKWSRLSTIGYINSLNGGIKVPCLYTWLNLPFGL
jgi:hypothetical protein